jgi:hypothetical protein
MLVPELEAEPVVVPMAAERIAEPGASTSTHTPALE